MQRVEEITQARGVVRGAPGRKPVNDPVFRQADPVEDRQALIDLNVEYVGWVFAQIEAMHGASAREILGVSVADYVPTVIDKVCGDSPPRGAFYLVENAGEVLAMGGLRWQTDGVAELKRLYVRPAGRGRHLGTALASRLVDDARAFGYSRVRLDTLPFMQAAQALYTAMGFVDCAAYPIEMPAAYRGGVRYMELVLNVAPLVAGCPSSPSTLFHTNPALPENRDAQTEAGTPMPPTFRSDK